jgi:hypothetical protein
MEDMDLPDAVACRGVEEPPVPVIDEEDEGIGFPYVRFGFGDGGAEVVVDVGWKCRRECG